MSIDSTLEFRPILEVLNCLEVNGPDQQLILDVLESNLEAWEHLRLKQRSSALRSTLQIINDSNVHPPRLVKSHFERCLHSVL